MAKKSHEEALKTLVSRKMQSKSVILGGKQINPNSYCNQDFYAHIGQIQKSAHFTDGI